MREIMSGFYDRRRRLPTLLVALAIGSTSGLAVIRQRQPEGSEATYSDPRRSASTETGIASAGDAILLSLTQRWPDGVNADSYDARLISVRTLETFLNQTDAARTDDTPVWIVGITTEDSLSVGDIAPPPGLPGAAPPWSVAGAYYAWTANDGLLISSGPLFAESSPPEARPKFSEIQALRIETLPL
jgi:hypothetical protein